MIFWDTSAIVPLLVDEPRSDAVRGVAREDPLFVAWWGTRVECVSAISRLAREGRLAADETEVALDLLNDLSKAWAEVLPTDGVRRLAERQLRRHRLRTADAFQLAAATQWAEAEPEGHRLFTFDERLAAAARAEGFRILS